MTLRIGDILVLSGSITEEQRDEILHEQLYSGTEKLQPSSQRHQQEPTLQGGLEQTGQAQAEHPPEDLDMTTTDVTNGTDTAMDDSTPVPITSATFDDSFVQDPMHQRIFDALAEAADDDEDYERSDIDSYSGDDSESDSDGSHQLVPL